MVSSKKIRISQSVLAAQRAIVQALEVLTKQEVVLDELTLTFGEITEVNGTNRRDIHVQGRARCLDARKKSSPRFSFSINRLPLIQHECWDVLEGWRCDFFIDSFLTKGTRHYSTYWNSGEVHLEGAAPGTRKTSWTIGRTWQDRREELV